MTSMEKIQSKGEGRKDRGEFPSVQNSRNVVFDADVLAILDDLARIDERSRSYVLNRLLRTHPEITRFRDLKERV